MFFKKKKNEEFNYHVLDKDNIPQHIAFIMDGNGRWVKKGRCHALMDIMRGLKQFEMLLCIVIS